MQIREVPVTPTDEGSSELDDEAEWIYRQAFTKPSISQQVCCLQYTTLIFIIRNIPYR